MELQKHQAIELAQQKAELKQAYEDYQIPEHKEEYVPLDLEQLLQSPVKQMQMVEAYEAQQRSQVAANEASPARRAPQRLSPQASLHGGSRPSIDPSAKGPAQSHVGGHYTRG